MEALDFILLVAGGWIAVIALAMVLLTAARRADESVPETAGEGSAFGRNGHPAGRGRMAERPGRRGSGLGVGAV